MIREFLGWLGIAFFKKRVSRVLVIPSVLFLSTLSQAPNAHALVVFDFAGTCTTNCSNFGATNGDPIIGSVAFNLGGLSPNQVLSAGNVSDLSLTLGTLNFDFPTDPPSLDLFFARVDGSATGLSQIRFRGVLGGTQDIFYRFPDIINTTDTWRVAECSLGTDCIGTNVLAITLGDSGEWNRVSEVPLPSGLGLLISALALFWFLIGMRQTPRSLKEA